MGSATKFAQRQAAALYSKIVKKKGTHTKRAEQSYTDELSGVDDGERGIEEDVDEEEEQEQEQEEQEAKGGGISKKRGGSGCVEEKEGSCYSI